MKNLHPHHFTRYGYFYALIIVMSFSCSGEEPSFMEEDPSVSITDASPGTLSDGNPQFLCSVPARPGLIRTYEKPDGDVDHTICSFDLAGSRFYVNPVPGATSYEWRILPGAGVFYGESLYALDYFYAPPGSYSLDVRAINNCGTGPWSGAGVTVTDCGPSFP